MLMRCEAYLTLLPLRLSIKINNKQLNYGMIAGMLLIVIAFASVATTIYVYSDFKGITHTSKRPIISLPPPLH